MLCIVVEQLVEYKNAFINIIKNSSSLDLRKMPNKPNIF